MIRIQLGSNLQQQAAQHIDSLITARVASRIAAKDASLWGVAAEPEASIRLGWVTSAKDSADLVPEILNLKLHFAEQGVDRFVLCGMGGSSLAPEVITGSQSVELVVLDSTEPAQVQSATVDLQRTAVVVSSKSGSTVETDSQKRHFEAAFRSAGIDPVGRIVVVTDPGSPLDTAARNDGYRVFNADPNVGGRYSALTAFGLVPSGLAGANIAELLSAASDMSSELASDSRQNPAVILAAALAATGVTGVRDKFALIAGVDAPGLGDWVEQLVAESTGKHGRGRLPVVVSTSAPELSMNLGDLLTVKISEEAPGDDSVHMSGRLGEMFITWEYATAMVGYLLGINPFDQPDVESAKIAARALLDNANVGAEPDFVDDGVAVNLRNLPLQLRTLEAALSALLERAKPESNYISIHAYVSRPGFPQLSELRDWLAAKSKRPVTFGWGPRFLHSTGQYHKGGPRQGLFLQIVSDPQFDLQVPGRQFSFGSLLQAQAAGDANVLAAAGDPVLTLRTTDVLALLERLKSAVRD